MRALAIAILLLAVDATADVRADVRTRLSIALENAVDDGSADIRIKGWKASQRSVLRKARRVMSVDLLSGERPYGQVTARARLVLRDGTEKSIFVQANVEVDVPVWVVERRTGRGAPLAGCSVRAEKRPLQGLPSGAIRATTSLTGRLAARTLTRGSVLTRGATTTPVLVRRGDSVNVTANVGGVRVRTRATAMGSGRMGQRINVRLASRRVLSGRVDGTNKVAVQ